jgi:hypothetical protein
MPLCTRNDVSGLLSGILEALYFRMDKTAPCFPLSRSTDVWDPHVGVVFNLPFICKFVFNLSSICMMPVEESEQGCTSRVAVVARLLIWQAVACSSMWGQRQLARRLTSSCRIYGLLGAWQKCADPGTESHSGMFLNPLPPGHREAGRGLLLHARQGNLGNSHMNNTSALMLTNAMRSLTTPEPARQRPVADAPANQFVLGPTSSPPNHSYRRETRRRGFSYPTGY